MSDTVKGFSGADWVGLLSGNTERAEEPPPSPPTGGARGTGVVGKNCLGGGGVTNRETFRVVAAVDIGLVVVLVDSTGWTSLAVVVLTVVVLRNVFLLL